MDKSLDWAEKDLDLRIVLIYRLGKWKIESAAHAQFS